jgi:hypothetical protein
MMRSRSLALSLALAFALSGAVSAWGQSVISAHSGTIHYTEGQVSLDGTAIQPKFGEFPEVKSGQVLSTQDGRAEILLTPGVFLRLGENSSFKMVSNQLSNTRLEVQSGEAMIEVGELLPDNAIAVVFHQGDISIAKRGLYRFDSDPAKLRVYEGEASVVSPSTDPTIVRKGHELIFGEAKLEARNFDAKETDEFYRWSARRDEYVAEANITSAKAVRDTNGGMGYAGGSCFGSGMGISSNTGAFSNVGTYYGTGVSSGATFSNVSLNPGLGLTPGTGVSTGVGVGSGVGMSPGMGSWAFNPWFGMFTYVPCSGTYFSPFGYGYFSPYAVGYLYGPYSPYAYGNGYAGGRTGIGNLGGIGRTGGLTSSAAAPATSSSIGRAAGSTGGFGNGGSNSSRGGGGGFGGSSGGGGISGGGGGISGGAHGGGSSGGKH